jgi:extracellular factor (EF) 3-hydroxypalmitic acid methyl ester biosynthesis protein
MPSTEHNESLVTCTTSQEQRVEGPLVKLTRHLAVFEVYGPFVDLRLSEVLRDFKVTLRSRQMYSGRAIVGSLIQVGATMMCEARLEESWADPELFSGRNGSVSLSKGYGAFFQEWQKTSHVLPEYKVIVSDFCTYLTDLQLWMDQVELGIRALPSGNRQEKEREIIQELAEHILPTLSRFFEETERIEAKVEEESRGSHMSFIRRQLHPLLLCSPFLYRTFRKPLGYAGDYEMVNMILRDPLEGSSVFSKVLNLWFLRQPPAEAHRNRVDYLFEQIHKEAVRRFHQGKRTRILSLGCGPSGEVQRWLERGDLPDHVDFTLIDFNDETLAQTGAVLDRLRKRRSARADFRLVKKSVNQVIKEGAKNLPSHEKFDLAYCAGLFDYLSDQTCARVMSILYDWTNPAGLVIGTNVSAFNPRRLTMDYVMEWNLNYRDSVQMAALVPPEALQENVSLFSDITGVNTFLEVRHP